MFVFAFRYIAVIVNPSLGIETEILDDTMDASGPTPTDPSGSSGIPIFIFDSLLDPNEEQKHEATVAYLAEYLQVRPI